MFQAPSLDLSAVSVTLAPGYAGTLQTIRHMRAGVIAARRLPSIRQAAVTLTFLRPEKSDSHAAQALFEYVRDCVRYVRDVWDVETVGSPAVTMAAQIGDCDDQAALLAALAESIGVQSRFVVAGYEGEPASHVYVQLCIDGDWVDCDPTMAGAPFGWAPPGPTFLDFERV